MDNRCISCGAIIPEGRFVCPICEEGRTEGMTMTEREKLIELTAEHQQEADKLSDAAKTACGDDRTVSVFKWMHSLAAAHKKFVAELDEVLMLLENGVTVQEWIPVTERLPEPGERVLVCIGAVFEAFIDDGGKWQRYYSAPLNEVLGEPTHWMPLPEPPKEG